LGLDQVKKESFFATYPNPVYDNLFINPLDVTTSILGYRIIDTMGRVVKRGNLDFDQGYRSIDMLSIKPGVYIVQLSDGERSEHKKIIKTTV
jgi:hypothetical protein